MATSSDRPTSPHLQVYRLPLTAVISICHRLTGVLLVLGLLMVVGLLLAVAGGPPSYQAMQAAMASGWFRVLGAGAMFALFFHMCHGVRHVLWDAGYGFARDRLTLLARLELAAALALTLLALLLV